jgi:hypothetical protein
MRYLSLTCKKPENWLITANTTTEIHNWATASAKLTSPPFRVLIILPNRMLKAGNAKPVAIPPSVPSTMSK